MKKISVIIPLYNCGDYIIRCLDSIFNQGLSKDDYEVIVVNDDSTDLGPQLVESYSKSKNNISLINQSNNGVSSARNLGLSKAEGEWIHFVDSDDFLMPNAYNTLIANCLTKDVEILKIKSQVIYKQEDFHKINNLQSSKIIFDGDAYDYLQKYGYNVAVITSLYKRDFLIKQSLKFESFSFSEDLLFNIRCYSLSGIRVRYTDAICYGYYVREESSSRLITTNKIYCAVSDYFGICEKINFLLEKPKYRDFIRQIKLNLWNQAFHKILNGDKLTYTNIKELSGICKRLGFYPRSTHKGLLIKKILVNHPILFYSAIIYKSNKYLKFKTK